MGVNIMYNKKVIFLSYYFRCKPEDLFFMLHKPEALQNWLADKVYFDSKTKIFTFSWNNTQEQAHVTEVDEKYHVLAWEWLGEHNKGEQIRFQVALAEDEEHTELIIEDICESGDEKIYQQKWDKIIRRLSLTL